MVQEDEETHNNLNLELLTAKLCPAGDDKDCFEKLVMERYTASVRSRLLPEATDGATNSFKAAGDQWKYIYSFFQGYLHGLENTSETMIVGQPGSSHQTGFEQGCQHLYSLQRGMSQSFELSDFGYVAVKTNGTYKWDFEESSFRPNGMSENWWVHFQVGVLARFAKTNSVKQSSLFSVRRSCVFKGWLSPDSVGFTGHMNQYARDFIVSEIIDVGSGPTNVQAGVTPAVSLDTDDRDIKIIIK